MSSFVPTFIGAKTLTDARQSNLDKDKTRFYAYVLTSFFFNEFSSQHIFVVAVSGLKLLRAPPCPYEFMSV